MPTVLGIDAAWTITQPSGVALAEKGLVGWRLVAVESSYGRFDARARNEPTDELASLGVKPDAEALLKSCRQLVGREPDLIAVDMPLARRPISKRRESDRKVSQTFGAQHCATHSPSALRPGKVSDKLRAAFETAGYHLWTETRGPAPGLIEVYPHPALLTLTGAKMRLPYKAGKTLTYWPADPAPVRRAKLFAVWATLVAALDREILGVAAALPALAPTTVGRALKAYEDKLDAVICAWIAIRVLERRAAAYGDKDSAIWIPEAEPTAIAGADTAA